MSKYFGLVWMLCALGTSDARAQVSWFQGGHGGGVVDVAVAQNGKVAVTCSRDQTAKLWDLTRHQLLATLSGHSSDVLCGAISPDGTIAATGSADKTIRIWSASTGKAIRAIQAHNSDVSDLCFSPSGAYIGSVSRDGSAKIWSATSGLLTLAIPSTGAESRCLSYSFDGSTIAIGYDNGQVNLVSATFGNVVRTMNGHVAPVDSVKFTSDGSRIVTGSEDSTIKVWTAQTGEVERTLRYHSAPIASVDVSADSQRIISTSRDRSVKISNINSGNLILNFQGHTDWTESAAFESSDLVISCGQDGRVLEWSSGSGQVVYSNSVFRRPISSIAVHPAAQDLYVASGVENFYDLSPNDGSKLRSFDLSSTRVDSVAISNGASLLASGEQSGVVKLWDTQTNQMVRQVAGHSSGITSIAFTQLDTLMLTGSMDRDIRVWVPQTGTLVRTIKAHAEPVRGISICPTANEFASCSDDKLVRIWNSETFDLLKTLVGHTEGVLAIDYDPNGTRLATGARDRTVRIWDVASGGTAKLLTGFGGEVTSLDFSNDGRYLVTGCADRRIRIWDVGTGSLVWESDSETGTGVTAVKFSALEDLIFVGRLDGTVVAFPNPIFEDYDLLKISRTVPTLVYQRASIPLTIYGSGFKPGIAVRLEKAGSQPILESNPTVVHSPFELRALVDLSAASPGLWDIVVRQLDGKEVRKVQGLSIGEGAGKPVFVGGISAPSTMRAGRLGTAKIEVINIGTGNGLAPLMQFEAGKPGDQSTVEMSLRLDPSMPWQKGKINFQSQGAIDASVLVPGEIFSQNVQFESPVQNQNVEWRLSQVTSLTQEIQQNGWAEMRSLLKPQDLDTDTWAAIWTNFTHFLGQNDSELFNNLRLVSKEYASYGSRSIAVEDLISVALAKATGEYSPLPFLSAMSDIEMPVPGGKLSFGRIYSSSLISRHTKRTFGLGWRSSYDYYLEVPKPGWIVISSPEGAQQVFSKSSTGKYSANPGDPSLLEVDENSVERRYSVSMANGTRITFDSSGLIRTMNDANNNLITCEYLGPQLSKVTDANGHALTLAYDGFGHVSEARLSNGKQATYSYNGDLLTSVSIDGRVWTYDYISAGTTQNVGTLTKITHPDGRDQTFEYYDNGLLFSVSGPQQSLKTTFEYGSGSEITINSPFGTEKISQGPYGQVLRSRDTLGFVTSRKFNNAFLPIETTRDQRTIKSVWDEKGNLLEGKDPRGNVRGASYTKDLNRLDWFRDARNQVVDFEFDVLGNTTGITYANGTRESFTHESWGGIKTHTNRRGQITAFQYDSEGRVTSVISPGEALSYSYDARGNLIQASSSVTGATRMYYDARDYLRRVEHPNGKWFEYTYDDAGRRTSRTGADSPALSYVYDSVGRLANVLADGQLLVQYQYDSSGRIANETRGNGTKTTYVYDAGSRPLKITHYGPGSILQAQYIYGNYDSFGNPATLATPGGVWNYHYDANNQLTSVVSPSGVSTAFAYDEEGNRLTQTSGGTTIAYSTNNMNQYLSASNEVFTYDADGNMRTRTKNGQTTSYDWSASGQLIKTQMPNGDVYEYQYDALGNRTRLTKNGLATTFVYDGGNITAEYSANGSLAARYMHGLGLVARQDASTIGYYGFDGTGHTRLVTGASGSIENSYELLPFGGFVAISESIPNRFRFVGKFGVVDDETGLYHMRARYYDPGLGRFISADPSGINGKQANTSAYCKNNPIVCVDPAGLEACWYKNSIPNNLAPIMHPGLDMLNLEVVHEHLWFSNGDNIGYGPGGLYSYGKAPSWAQGINVAPDIPHIVTGPYSCMPDDEAIRAVMEVSDSWRYRHNGLFDPYNLVLNNCQSFADSVRINTFFVNLFTWPTRFLTSWDPNEKVGPLGIGTNHYVEPDGTMDYTINFENKADAGAHAQEVVVTDVLDLDLDMGSMELGEVQVGSQTVSDMIGFQSGSIRVPLKDSNLLMDVAVTYNLSSRLISWHLKAIDPRTGDLPDGVNEGILPPNDASGSGEAHVRFRIKPKSYASQGAKIENKATIIFDNNPAIVTNTWTNTIDRLPPTSKVESLPSTVPSRFKVLWSGTDTFSGVESFDIYVSVNGGTYTKWLAATKESSAIYETVAGKQLRFYSVARDLVGNEELPPTAPDATTTTTRLPLPDVDSIVVTHSANDLNLLIRGGYFKPNAEVTWNGSRINVTWINEYRLEATVVGAASGNAAQGSVVVYNPDPEGGYSRLALVNVSSGIFAGVVDLRNYSGPIAGMNVSVNVYSPGTETLLQSTVATLSPDGSFVLALGLASGSYDVQVKAPHWISRRVKGVQIQTGVWGFTASLVNGDCDGDNYIGTDDYLILNGAFDSATGDANFDPRADLNGDGYVGTDDYLILNESFDSSGE